MAGTIIVSSIKTDTDNSFIVRSNTGATLFSVDTTSISIPDGSITSAMIANGTVIAADVADGSITTSKIADGNVTNAKIDSVANTKITGLVTSAQIANVANTQLTGSIEATQVGTTVSQLFGMRNRIINGDMRIDQRNAGASVTPTNGSYGLDRWSFAVTQASKFTAQQNAGSVTPPAGFSNYLGITSSSAYSITSGDIFYVKQPIEGFNTSDLDFGTANAKTITLSFWVRSSLTGTFGGALQNSAENRSYPFSYTISSANTWEQKTVTIAGDTSGTWIGATNGIGMSVIFGLGVGSTYTGTANAWQGAQDFAPTGATSVVGTNGATWYLTGVQFEVGSTATPFERRHYGQELALCRRYYQKLNAGGVAYTSYGSGYTFSSTGMTISSTLNPVMRTTPSATASGSNRIVTHGGSYTVTSFGGITGGTDTFYMTFQSAGTFSSALPGFVGPNNDTTASINLDSEL